MRHIRRIIGLHVTSGLSVRLISRALSVPPSTVADYIRRFRAGVLSPSDIRNLNDRQVYAALFPEQGKGHLPGKPLPDFSLIHRELRRKHVTRLLLWEEYREQHPGGYGYTQFCELYRQWSQKISVSMRQVHRAGEKLFVDYSGLTMEIIDPVTGEISRAEILVACLGASGYTYAEASNSQKKENFLASHRRAFEFFGGVPEVIVPDNLKSAVTDANWYDPDLNESYKDMAEHYGAVILPARPARPKDKAKVELSVKLVQRWILARLRHRQFFSLAELNAAIRDLLHDLNRRVIKYLGKSRHELYLELDQPALKPLPRHPYIYRAFKECRVNIDYHIQLEKAFYSVPYQLTGRVVTVRYSETTVEVYHEHTRVAVHRRLYRRGSYSTHKEHMASAHRAYAEWTPSRIIGWGKSYGPQTGALMEKILQVKPHPEMGFRSCMGILRQAKNHDPGEIEAASLRMLELGLCRVKHFKAILTNKTGNAVETATVLVPESHHENVRGQAYYE
ncbi:MAG: IS21 family transposase [Candidatus Marinimicrobia bacterium]|nr:IS21 family transposase [Candidatus Neomarinimicrobiota bacterium]